jgi:hypothetical protein
MGGDRGGHVPPARRQGTSAVTRRPVQLCLGPRIPSGSGHVGHGPGSLETSQPLGSGIKGTHWVQRPPQFCLIEAVHGTEILPRAQPHFSGFEGTSWVLQPLQLCSKDANLSVDAGDLELHVSRDWDHLLATHLSDPMQHFEGSMGLSVTLSPQPSGGDGPLEVMSSPLQMNIQHFPDELLGLNKTLSP